MLKVLKGAKDRKIKGIIKRVRDCDIDAIKELLDYFGPLIYNTCKALYNRYGGYIPMEELVENSRHILLSLTILEYDPHGKARYPYFIKTHLNARLTQLYRPILAYKSRAISLRDNDHIVPPPYDKMYEDERIKILGNLTQYICAHFNEREMDIIYNHIEKGVPRTKLAEKYHISAMRMKHIHKRCINKLKQYLEAIGIKSIQDI